MGPIYVESLLLVCFPLFLTMPQFCDIIFAELNLSCSQWYAGSYNPRCLSKQADRRQAGPGGRGGGKHRGGTGQQRGPSCLAIHVNFLIMWILFSKNILDEVERCFGSEEDVGYRGGGGGDGKNEFIYWICFLYANMKVLNRWENGKTWKMRGTRGGKRKNKLWCGSAECEGPLSPARS